MANKPRRFYPRFKRPSSGGGGIYDDQQSAAPTQNRKTGYDSDAELLDRVNNEAKYRGKGDLWDNDSGEQADDQDSTDSLSPEQIKAAEEGGDSAKKTDTDAAESEEKDQLGKGFRQEDESSDDPKNVRARLKSKRKAFFMGGGIAAGVVGALIAVFLAFAPLKILNTVENLQERFFATSESAVQRRTEALMNKYLKKYVIPGLGSRADCNATTRTISKNCIAAIPGNSKADRLYRAWRDARLENSLAEKYGFEIRKTGTQYFLDVGSNSPLDISNMGLNDQNRNLFNDVGGSRSDLRQAMSKALEDETRWKKTMYRFKYGRLMERKYGLRRCIFFCKARDNLDDWKENKRNAAKLIILRRIVEPNTELVGLALSCLVEGSCIDPDASPDPSNDGTGRKDTLEKQIRGYLDERGIQYADDTVEKLVELMPKVTEILDKGMTTYLVAVVLEKIFNEQVAKMAEKYIPVIGWIDTGARIVNTIANAGAKIRRYSFVIKSTAMISLYMSYRTYADEIKTGNVDSELAGSMIEQLSDEAGDSEHYGQPAENSPLYAALFDDTTITTSALPSLLTGTAFAQSPTPKQATYICDNGEQIEPGKLICDEEKLAASGALTAFSDVFNQQPLSYLKEAADFWLDSGGAILDRLGSLLSFIGPSVDAIISVIPGISYLKANFEQLTGSLLQAIANYIFPPAISVGMSGARTFSQMAGGASAAGSAFAHYGLGGALLSPEQTASIVESQQQQYDDLFKDRSVFARMFDTQDRRSLVSRTAMSLPTKSTFIQGGFLRMISNPFEQISNSFGSIFTTRRTQAALAQDPFGVPSFGYGLDVTNFDYAPDLYTDEYCTQVNAEWEAGTGQFEGTLIIDPETGTDIHTKSNPCLLEAAATGSGGGYFDSSVLTPDEVNGP